MTTQITGPKGLPISGNLLSFRKDPLSFLIRAAGEYGDVARIRVGPRNLYLINNPEYIKEILIAKQDSFVKAKGLQVAKLVVGEGILTSEGKHHLRQRRLMQPAFHQKRIATYGDIMVQETIAQMDGWQDNEERDIHHDMMKLTLSIINKTMFGTDVMENADQIGRAVEVGLQFVSRKATSILDIPLEVPTRNNREFQAAAELLDKTIYAIIEERRKQPVEPERDDLLSMLLAARDEEDGTGMSDKQVRDEVMTIFVAGHETTANTLSWIWYLLSAHPEVENAFFKELETVLDGRNPTVEDIPRLPLVNQIIQEAMRLYPAAWVINREVATEVEIGGYAFKPGDTLMMSQYVMHRNPRYYDEPDRFKPERFAGDLLKRIPQFAYFPFGGGPRICIGNNFALMEAALLLATIGQRYRFTLKPGFSVEPEPVVTLRPKNGLEMIVHKR